MELDPIEHYDAKHAGLIPARFYKDREGVTRHLTGECIGSDGEGMFFQACDHEDKTLEGHGRKNSYDEPIKGFLGRRV